MRVLVLGAYGLIGLEIAKALHRAGHAVTGLGRSERRGRALLPEIDWVAADIATLTTPADWGPMLADVDAVVNSAGILQSGFGDSVSATQRDAIVALIAACETGGVRKFIQISAPGAVPDANTAFYSTKGEADAALTASTLDWTILRPGLVIAPSAYGGTSLLRMLGAVPLVQPIVLAEARMQTVAVGDVAEAVRMAIEGDMARRDFDLVEDEAHTLKEIVCRIRAWQGFASARAMLTLPRWAGYGVAKAADLAGWLGWRPALRTTALKVLEKDVMGDPRPWAAASGMRLNALSETLRALPSTAQERIYARALLAFPVLVLTLAIFWIVSGAIGLWRLEAAAAVLADHLPETVSWVAAAGAGLLDIALGLGLLVRRLVRPACCASILVCVVYLAGATLMTPELWADLFGPLVKVFPAMALAAAVWALAEER